MEQSSEVNADISNPMSKPEATSTPATTTTAAVSSVKISHRTPRLGLHVKILNHEKREYDGKMRSVSEVIYDTENYNLRTNGTNIVCIFYDVRLIARKL